MNITLQHTFVCFYGYLFVNKTNELYMKGFVSKSAKFTFAHFDCFAKPTVLNVSLKIFKQYVCIVTMQIYLLFIHLFIVINSAAKPFKDYRIHKE